MHYILTLLLILLFCTNTTYAEIYKYIDEEGKVTYSDKPHPDAEKIYTSPLQGYSTPPRALSPESPTITPPTLPEKISYSIAILSPTQKETIRATGRQVPVEIKLDPSLQKTDQLIVLLDEQIVATSTSNQVFTLENVDRGKHQLMAEIRDKDGTILAQSTPVTFYYHQYSQLTAPIRPAAKP